MVFEGLMMEKDASPSGKSSFPDLTPLLVALLKHNFIPN
jgi:hypothetical protein